MSNNNCETIRRIYISAVSNDVLQYLHNATSPKCHLLTVSLKAVKLPGRRRVTIDDVISGGVIVNVVADDVVAEGVTSRLRHGASIRQHDAPPAVVDHRRRRAPVASGRRSRRFGQAELLEDAAFDGLDASALQQEPLHHAAVRGRRLVERALTTTILRRRERCQRHHDTQP